RRRPESSTGCPRKLPRQPLTCAGARRPRRAEQWEHEPTAASYSGLSAACGEDISARAERYDMTARQDRADSSDSTEKAEPAENNEAKEPTEPTDKAEPTEPMDSTEPRDPIDRNES